MPDDKLPVDGPDASVQDAPATTPVDAIAHSLRRQHLHPDSPTFTHSADAPFLGSSTSPLKVDPMHLDTAQPTTARRGLDSASAGHFPRLAGSRLRPKYSANFSDTASGSHAKQDLVQGMIISGTQCHVRNPPAPAPIDITATSSLRVPPDNCPPEVGDDIEDHVPLEDSSVESSMNRSRSGGNLALERHGFPLYRTSREVALRSQNLVRNKPRMRKRAKLREKHSMSAIPAVSGLTVAPPTSSSS